MLIFTKKTIYTPPHVYWEFIDSGLHEKDYLSKFSLWMGDTDYGSLGREIG
jgi:hypothetical protein